MLCVTSLAGSTYAEDETLEDIYRNHEEYDPFTDPEKFAEKYGLLIEGDFDPKSVDYFFYNRHIIVNVGEDNVIEFTELTDVYFGAPLGGITYTIPRYNTVAYANDIKTMGYPEIYEIYSDQAVKTEKTDDELKVTVGSGIYTGFRQFRLRYKVDLGPDPLTNCDELYLYLISMTAERPTLRCQFEIYMPKAFAPENVTFSYLKGSGNDDILTYTAEGNEIKGETTYHLDANTPLALRVELPDGYFSKAERSYDPMALVSLGATTLMVIICMALYMRSRSRNKEVSRIDFYPPKELNPVEACYLKYGKLTDKKITILLPYLAARGCFRVRELSKGKGKLDRKSCAHIYCKNSELPGMHPDEKIFIEGMFGRGKTAKDEVTDDDFRNSFYRTIDRIKHYATNDKSSSYSTFFEKGGRAIKIIYMAVMMLFSWIGIGLPLSISDNNDGRSFSIVFFVLAGAGIAVLLFVLNIFDKKIRAAVSAAIGIASFFLLPVSGSVIFPCDIALLTAFIALLTVNVFTSDIKKIRTPHAKTLYDRLMGFERFLETSDTRKLQSLCEQNRDYLYDILPYTQALDIPLPRPSKLEKEYLNTAPEWYEMIGEDTSFSYFNMLYLYDSAASELIYRPTDAVKFDVTSIPPQITNINKK